MFVSICGGLIKEIWRYSWRTMKCKWIQILNWRIDRCILFEHCMVSLPFVPQRNIWKYRQKNEFRTEFLGCSFSQSDPYSSLMIMNLQISWEVLVKKEILHSKAHFPPVVSISSKYAGAFTNQEGSEKLICTNAVWGNLIFSKCRRV